MDEVGEDVGEGTGEPAEFGVGVEPPPQADDATTTSDNAIATQVKTEQRKRFAILLKPEKDMNFGCRQRTWFCVPDTAKTVFGVAVDAATPRGNVGCNQPNPMDFNISANSNYRIQY
jgi:hypothetical protein